MPKFLKLPLLALMLLASGCQPLMKVAQNAEAKQRALYQAAVEDAQVPTPSEVHKQLTAITPQNKELIWKEIEGEPYVLVVTWKKHKTYYEPYLDSARYNTQNRRIWVTAAPELKQRMKKERSQDIDLRIKQLLGLPPNGEYHYFIEFWVKPEQLFRPCPDSEITDSQCNLCFKEEVDSAHFDWINQYRVSSYYQCNLYEKYPWTQLGYTYDWNPKNKSHIGLSEFVIDTQQKILVEAIYTTEEYLDKGFSE